MLSGPVSAPLAHSTEAITTDVVIIGAGPCGLFQVFELGLLGIRAHVIETLPRPGGQCSELYPDKPIYDIPGLPAVNAQQLVDNLLQQASPFDPVFHFNQQVRKLLPVANGRFQLETTAGTRFDAANVIIAGGVGAFEPVRLKVAGAEQLAGTSLHYAVTDPTLYQDREVVILGGGDAALDWALELQKSAASVLLIHRSETFRAAPASVQQMRSLCEREQMQYLTGTVAGLHHQSDRLTGLDVVTPDGITRRIGADSLLVFYGLSPKLGPIADWDLSMQRKQIVVDTQRFQTSVPGVFAIGDINWYPGKKKLILSGFHEAALAAFAVKERLQPGEKISLQYTTTSTQMHKRLGVENPYSDRADEARGVKADGAGAPAASAA